MIFSAPVTVDMTLYAKWRPVVNTDNNSKSLFTGNLDHIKAGVLVNGSNDEDAGANVNKKVYHVMEKK